MKSLMSLIGTVLALAALTIANPQAATTTTPNPYASTPSACPERGGVFYYLQGNGTGTPADGTYLTGVIWEPDYLAVFNPEPSNGYGPQLSVQSYQYDFYSQSWWDGVYYWCIQYDATTPNLVSTCKLPEYNNGKSGALVCNSNFYQTKKITCTVDGSDGTVYDTLYVVVTGNSQQLAIGTAANAQAAGNQLTLVPYDANCGY